MANRYIFKELDKEKILKIYELAATTRNWKDSLDKIIAYMRQYFIFDNIVIYLGEVTTKRLDVFYARATGRGKSMGADISWGETIANRVVCEKKTLIEEPGENNPEDRLRSPFMLGVPLFISRELTGALVFIRFGGPAFETGSMEFAEFLGMQFASLIRQKSLDDYEKELTNLRASSTLQGDFISTISHELRNPLGFIRGYTTTLLREDASWDKTTQRDFLEIIDRETSHLAELIDDLLDSSRLQNGNLSFDFQLLHLDTIIRDEVTRAQHAKPHQVINLDLVEPLPLITGDPRRLAQVIDNLIENSEKYAPDAEISIRAYPVDSEMIIEYADSGPGVDEKYLPMMFSRFFRAPGLSRTIYGTGLGLSICKQIINSHNGEITVSSSCGEGIKFTITLPLNKND